MSCLIAKSGCLQIDINFMKKAYDKVPTHIYELIYDYGLQLEFHEVAVTLIEGMYDLCNCMKFHEDHCKFQLQ